MPACIRRSCRLLLYLEVGGRCDCARCCCYLGISSHSNVYFGLSLRILRGTEFALEYCDKWTFRPYPYCTKQASKDSLKVSHYAIHYHVVRVQRVSGSDWGMLAACFTGDTRN